MGSKKSKIKVEDNTITIEADSFKDALDALAPKPYEITAASIKDMKCNYGYEIKTGPTAGDKIPTRKGEAIVHEDMINAFAKLKVHLAIADDAFKHLFDELPSIDELKDHEIVNEFIITGFKIQGSEEDEGYTLIGEKYVTLGAISLDTPKITSRYQYYDELKEDIGVARNEVELYLTIGKCAPRDDDEEEDKSQLKFPFDEKPKFSADEFDDVE
jgi:hypothetical protein